MTWVNLLWWVAVTYQSFIFPIGIYGALMRKTPVDRSASALVWAFNTLVLAVLVKLQP